jgi:hypothetical protein
MDLIRKCRGIALDKGNYESDDSNWRPICIGDAILSVCWTRILKQKRGDLERLAGVKTGHQIGLSKDTIAAHNRKQQLLFDIRKECGKDKERIIIKLHVSNAFNTLHRTNIMDFCRTHLAVYENFLAAMYNTPSVVVFNDFEVIMQSGVQ